MVFSLLLVMALMIEARKPENWEWMWAGVRTRTTTLSVDEDIDTKLPPQPEQAKDPPGTVYANERTAPITASPAELMETDAAAEEDENARERIRRDAWRGLLKQLNREERTVLERVLRASRGGPELSPEDLENWSVTFQQIDQSWNDYLTKANDAVLVAGDSLPSEQRTHLLNVLRELELEWSNLLRPALSAVLEDRPWMDLERDALAKLQTTLDQLALAAIRDDMVWRPEEQTAWFRSFEKLKSLTDRELKEQSLGSVGFVQLFRQTNEYRGKLVTVRGTAELAYHVPAPKNDLGIERYYVFWLRPSDGADAPLVAYALELPPGFPNVGSDHTNLREEMTFTGYFFKRWAYGARDGIRTAPLVLANRPSWQPAKPIFSAERPSVGMMVVAVLAIALLAVAIAWWVYKSSNARMAPRQAEGKEPTPNQFAAMAAHKIGPTVTEALQKRSERDKQD
ncbi:MAG: hypothetical protein H6822_21480 [Planctomycetaceae bacterium]|nr:hypothetical protein [Planctomycetales bacterium]MCB9924767.1 hypothetical protein [Planctomycetaceae bacterium]